MQTVADDDKRLKFVPLDQAADPPSGLIEHLKDRWWVTHPERGLVFWVTGQLKSPQCNSSESIARHLAQMYPWAEVRFVPSVFRRINPSDYTN